MEMNRKYIIDPSQISAGEREEMIKIGILSQADEFSEYNYPEIHSLRPPLEKRKVSAPDFLNEAFSYLKPSSFSRALALDLGDYRVLLISGTASVNQEGKAEHIGDFGAQTWRTYRNITGLLEAEKMTWHDVVRTTVYIKDIERDYARFNQIRTTFFTWLGLDPLPASTGIQARLCWDSLLVEMEAIAVSRP